MFMSPRDLASLKKKKKNANIFPVTKLKELSADFDSYSGTGNKWVRV